ncbi:gamma-glutamyl hydrolase-like [Halictus rubicundus]|uniref:gamma-glutamyl hydrolase-like n=1 Tax=Halictus rubicundus TaxID=77578 RepID=UPI004036ED31
MVNGLAIIFLFTFMAGMATASVRSTDENEFPIIGVLSLEVSPEVKKHYPDEDSYIAASYVKFAEGAGARVAPIWIRQNRSYYENIMRQINGILLPGGATFLHEPNGYGEAVCEIYDIAKKMNDEGVYFPIFGICLGFEALIYAMAGRRMSVLSDCSAQDYKLPLVFEPGYQRSKMFGDASETIINRLEARNLTYNFHKKCVTKQILKDHGIADQLRTLSTNKDKNGLEFISSIESPEYPFYGVQFHPEKNLYEWKRTKDIPHGKYASRISQYFGNFFVNEARKNDNHFGSKEAEERALIYNYNPTYTPKNTAFVQSYFFKKH